ncbi:hypothetical protein EI94DRAFT_1216035 [Lactarius quietus]|nr:hypothetical protein EI94DRAFT_1216035 [Lactarius quietus]
MLNPPAPPPPLTPTATQRANTHVDLRAGAATTAQRQPTSAVSATASTSSAVPSPSSPSKRRQVQSTQTILNSPTVIESPTRGRSLRATASMIWKPGKRHSSPTRSTTTPTSPSSTSAGVTNVEYDTPVATLVVGHDGGPLSPSLVQEEEEENFVTPPGSPVRSPLTLPIPTLSSRHPSPVRMGVTLRDEGPMPPVSPARSETHARAAARTPTITPRPSINALHAFAPPNPSPLSNQSFERQALMPPVPPSPPKRDTVLSVGDTESLIDLYVHSAPAPSTSPRPDDDEHHRHYPGRPLPHPPGASHSGPVQPVLLDAFLGGGNIPGGLPAYEEVELERQGGIWQFLPFSRETKAKPAAPCVPPPSPPVPRTPPRRAPPELFTVFDEDATAEEDEEEEPSSPGSTYEMPPSTPPSSTVREFADMPDEEDPSSEARHSTALPPYYNSDRRCAHDDEYDGAGGDDDDDDDRREWNAAGTRSDAQWTCASQVGAWRERVDAVQRS